MWCEKANSNFQETSSNVAEINGEDQQEEDVGDDDDDDDDDTRLGVRHTVVH